MEPYAYERPKTIERFQRLAKRYAFQNGVDYFAALDAYARILGFAHYWEAVRYYEILERIFIAERQAEGARR